jgi:GMP synthase (glutamine-hydrolysing)
MAIFRMGSSYAEFVRKKGDFTDWVTAGCGLRGDAVTHVDAQGGASLPAIDRIRGAILTGSHAYVTERAPWSEAVAEWIREAVSRNLPLLGICYGHQLIAHALGGRSAVNPAGLEFGTVEITTTASAAHDPLFQALFPGFHAHTCHTQTVVQLPSGAILLATSRRDAHQAFRVGRCCWGVQFHPEFDGTAMRYYIDQYRQPLIDQGSEPERLKSAVAPTPRSNALLPAFTALAQAALAGA